MMAIAPHPAEKKSTRPPEHRQAGFCVDMKHLQCGPLRAAGPTDVYRRPHCRGVGSAPPVGPALPGRVKPGPYKAPLIPDCQKRLAEFAARRPRIVFNTFLAAACTSRKILCAERVCFRAFLRENARVGAKSLLSKKATPFFDKLLAIKENPRLCRGEKIAYGEGQSRQEKVSELE